MTFSLLLVAGEAAPVAGAEIRVDGSTITGTTDAFGKCILKGVEPGTTRISISHRNYAQKTIDAVRVKAGKSNKVKADLERAGG